MSKELILALNRKQMHSGKHPGGGYFERYKSQEYGIMKQRLGSRAPFMTPDLLLTGSFSEHMTLHVSQSQYIIFSTDDKNNKLVMKYDPFGLSDKDKEVAKGEVMRHFTDQFKKHTKLS